MESELRMLEEGLQVNIHSDGLKATLKKIANWKTTGLDLKKKITSFYDRLATEMNKCIQKSEIPKTEYYTVSKGIKYPTKSYSLSRRPCKPGEWN